RRQRWEKVLEPTYRMAPAKAISVSSERVTGGVEHGTEWGTVMHGLLKTAMSEPTADLRSLAETLLSEVDLDTALAESAVTAAQSVMESEIWRRAERASRRFVELSFQILLKPDHELAEQLPTILRGTIDLVFEEPAGWVIVDYKTDSDAARRRDQLVAHYR